MGVAEQVAAQLSTVDPPRSETAVFVEMDGVLAVVNFASTTVRVPCVGFYPPVTGMVVQIEWRAGRPVLTGPAKPLNPIGTVTATGTPKVTVSVDGETHMLFMRSGYTPTVGDTVEINWATGVVQGKITGLDTPTAPPTTPPPATPFEVTVRAQASGRYQTSWWGSDPWASNNNDGIWVYGNAVADAVGGGTVTGAQIYLPLIQQTGNCSIGTHAHASIPGGAPAITNLTSLPLGQRSGWQTLPAGWAAYLATGGKGVGVTAPGGGYTQWRGVPADSLSGALRITGTR